MWFDHAVSLTENEGIILCGYRLSVLMFVWIVILFYGVFVSLTLIMLRCVIVYVE